MTAPAPLQPSPLAVREFLGLVGYAGLGTFALLARDAAQAPDIRTRLVLSRMAAGELAEIDYVEHLVSEWGGEFDQLLVSYRDLLNDFMVRAVPRDWWERLVRTYVGYNMLEDMLGLLADGLPPSVRDRVEASVGKSGHDDYVAAMLTPVLQAEPQLAARLGLWGRRVAGESLTLVQRLFAEHPALVELVTEEGDEAARLSRLMGHLHVEHSRRLQRLGLNA
ncbi:MAG: hypothetical protein GX427_07290 [Actinomycetales bacterium]|nr:hypothetical protein [Actinomycetales bacterium]